MLAVARTRAVLLLASMLLLTMAGCVRDVREVRREPLVDLPDGASSMLFIDGAGVQPVRRENGSAEAASLAGEWQVDRRFTGTVSSQGSQGRMRVRATRDVGGYTETFNGTTGPQGSTYRRSFRESSRRSNTRPN